MTTPQQPGKEEKAAYFAQYWGQKVAMYASDQSIKLTIGHPFVSIEDIDSIELTPLSEITDEDAIEVARILYPGYRGEWKVCDKGAALLKLRNNKGSMLIIWKDLSGQYGVNDLDYYLLPRVVDFLRSKGYALPFRDYSVEQLQEIGWLKLKP